MKSNKIETIEKCLNLGFDCTKLKEAMEKLKSITKMLQEIDTSESSALKDFVDKIKELIQTVKEDIQEAPA